MVGLSLAGEFTREESMSPAKLLLFGEHTILHGGEALALPLARFGASLVKNSGPNSSILIDWAAYAKTHESISEWLNLELWTAEAAELSIESSIPANYGLGSSGALTALLYGRYAYEPLGEHSRDWPQLKSQLGALESFFHGRSSGLDPLVCFLNKSVRIHSDGHLSKARCTMPSLSLALPDRNIQKGPWFLHDSGMPKAGIAAIARFGKSCQYKDFRQNYLVPALELNYQLIEHMLADEADEFVLSESGFQQKMRRLSELQLEHLSWLIPPAVAKTWQTWLEQDIAYLKLCGAGGGGFFLGYAVDK